MPLMASLYGLMQNISREISCDDKCTSLVLVPWISQERVRPVGLKGSIKLSKLKDLRKRENRKALGPECGQEKIKLRSIMG
jgi:hypothetical protein